MTTPTRKPQSWSEWLKEFHERHGISMPLPKDEKPPPKPHTEPEESEEESK